MILILKYNPVTSVPIYSTDFLDHTCSFRSSLGKVMIRTCMGRGTESNAGGVRGAGAGGGGGANGRSKRPRPLRPPPDIEPPSYSSSTGHVVDRSLYDNGDVFGHAKNNKAEDVFPEEIPGLPRHRPGEFSPR